MMWNAMLKVRLIIQFIVIAFCLIPFFSFTQESEKDFLGVPPKELNEKLQHYIKYSTNEPNHVGYIEIANKTSIDQSTWVYVKSSLDTFKKDPPIFIILDLDTPGGEIFAAEKISDALKEMDISYGIPVVAVIDNWAMSAGAMLAYSCRFIAITKDAGMGAAEPVTQSQTGQQETASEKINSALRADFANRAEFFDRNPLIAEAMVDKDLILVLRNGVVLKLDNENQIITTGNKPDRVISPKGKLLTLTSKELIEFGVADILLLPEKLQPISQLEKEEGKWPASKMLLFEYPFFADIPNASIVAFTMDWKTTFFAWLANPVVSSLLFLGLMIGFYMEINHPGFGLPGIIGLSCLLLIILSSFSLEAVNWLEIIILLIGIVLILVEIFVLPGFGLPGILGILLTLAGLVLMMLPSIGSFEFTFDPDKMSAAFQYFLERLAWIGGTLIFGVFCMYLLAKYAMPKFSRFSRLVLTGEQESSKGYVAGMEVSTLPAIGTEGEAFSPLRPSGKVLIQDTVYDAMTQGGFIDKGVAVQIIRYDGSKMIVDELEQT